MTTAIFLLVVVVPGVLALGHMVIWIVASVRWWLSRPKPVVGQVLPFHDPKKRKRFESWL